MPSPIAVLALLLIFQSANANDFVLGGSRLFLIMMIVTASKFLPFIIPKSCRWVDCGGVRATRRHGSMSMDSKDPSATNNNNAASRLFLIEVRSMITYVATLLLLLNK